MQYIKITRLGIMCLFKNNITPVISKKKIKKINVNNTAVLTTRIPHHHHSFAQ